MIRTLLSTFIRNIRKNLGFSTINILGFTIGIASFILIMLFISHELSWDRHNENADRTYRLTVNAMIGDTRINQTFTSVRMFREMKERFPEIESGSQFFSLDNVFLRQGDLNLAEPHLVYADSMIFDVFTFELIEGDPKTALSRPNTVVLSEAGARRYFGDEDPIGKDLTIDISFGGVNGTEYEVTGIFKDIPDNSHFHFDVMGSLTSFHDLMASNGWTNNNYITYFRLKPNTSSTALETKFIEYVKENIGDRYEEWTQAGNYWEFELQPLLDIHLRSDLNGEFETNGNIRYIYIFSIIGFFVLIIACINFMNLSTARSLKRAREVGIRKVVGSTRGLLIRQFLAESIVLTLVAMFLAIIASKLILPSYGDWLNNDLNLGLISKPWTIPAFVGGGVVIGILSGIYPAFFLSAFKPTRVLKSSVTPPKGGPGLRNALVIIQFAASVFLIISTIIVSKQMNFLRNTPLGFEKEDIMIVDIPPSFADHIEPFKQEMLGNSGVKSITAASGVPGASFNNIGFRAEGLDQSFSLNLYACDPDYFETLGLEMKEGRFFSWEFGRDTTAIILNETAVKLLGLENPIGTRMGDNVNDRFIYEVVGVVKDFHYESMHSEIRPFGFFFMGGPQRSIPSIMAISYDKSIDGTIAALTTEALYKIAPDMPCQFSFLETNYDNLYANEKQTGQVFGLLGLLALIVSTLGLLGLAAFNTQQKTREIAVRKVFGARVTQILQLLIIRFSKWVFVAFILASPLAFWMMKNWLQNFEYKTPISWWVFLIAGLSTIIVAVVTVGTVTYRSAKTNASEALKCE